MTEMHCKSVSFPHDTLRSLLSDAIIELCRREAFYVEELRIEGTICVVSDRSSALIVQITEQVGHKTSASDNTSTARDGQLPVVVTTELNCDGTSEAPATMRTNSGQGCSSSAVVKQYIRRRLRSCRHCGAHFMRLGSLQSHVRRRHPLAVFSSRRKGLVSYLSSSKARDPADCNAEGSGTNVFNPNMVLSALKSEPGYSADSLHGFPPDLNLGLQQMVRTLSMMSSIPINNNGHFPPGFAMASSGAGTFPRDDDQIELRRSADGKFTCPYCTKTYGFKHSLKVSLRIDASYTLHRVVFSVQTCEASRSFN